MKKKTFLIVVLLFTTISTLQAQKNNPVEVFVNSTEITQVNGSFTITGFLKVLDSVYFESNPIYNAANQYSLNSIELNNLTGNNRNNGDSIPFHLIFNYDPTILPFYPLKVEIQINSKRVNASELSPKKIPFYIYFTPYNTIEIWNMTDFSNLKRRWLQPTPLTDTTRISVPLSSIPVSNIENDYFVTEDWQDEFRIGSVPGLAYEVLMKPVPPDSTEYFSLNYGDVLGDPSYAPTKTFTGTVYGTLKTTITNDVGDPIEIPMSGIKVNLKERDYYGFVIEETFAEGYTDNNGNYSLSYNKSQSWLEGSTLEMYIKFESHTSGNYDIRCTNASGMSYEVVTYEWNPGTNGGTTEHSYNLANDVFKSCGHPEAFRVTHWIDNGYRYFAVNSLGLGAGLRLNINCWTGSWYNPYSNNGFGVPCINLDYDDDETESTTYHEFGHHTMYRLQGNNFILPNGTNWFNHSWDTENTSLLAWIEGWADFIEMALDGAYWTEDQEYGSDGSSDRFEVRQHYSMPSHWNITKGFRSEYYIACALYDLWDGPNKSLPTVMLDGNGGHGWNDSNQGTTGWATIDDVELTIHDICFPLLQSGYPERIQAYYQSLINHISNNTSKSDIARAFRENRVQWNAHEYQWGWHNTSLDSDGIYLQETYNENPTIGGSYTDTYNVNFYNKNTSNQSSTYFGGGSSSQPWPILDNMYLGLWDSYSNIYRTANLNLAANYFATFGQNRIYINNGSLIMGNNAATDLTENDNSVICVREHGVLDVKAGSTLTVKSGASFVVQSEGTIHVYGNGKILFKTGAFVCFGDNVNVILHDVGSTIQFETNVNMGLAPDIIDFHINQSCHTPSSIPFSGNGSIIFNCSDYVTFTHLNDFVVNSNNITLNGQSNRYKQNIIVEPGYTLTLNNCNFQFSKFSKVIVKPGGKLILNNSSFNKIAECTEPWIGIEVWGNKYANQFPDANGNYQQGVIELNSSTIENAKTAVDLWKMYDYNKTGGIIIATNSTFRNNNRSINATSYKNTLPNNQTKETDYRGIVNNCTFEITSSYIPTYEFYKHVQLSDIRGFSIIGSDFSLSPNAQGVSPWNQAIAAYSAGFNLKGKCLSPWQPCSNYDECNFSGFYWGIYSSNTLNKLYTFNVNHANFSNNILGVYTDGIDNPVITNCDFSIGYNNSQSCPDPSGFGISLFNSSGFAIEENTFVKQPNSPLSIYTGISIDNSKATEEIYKNDFSGLSYANYSKNINSRYPDLWEGLSYSCNTNTNNFADFYVKGTPQQFNEGIQSFQGTDYLSAGNTFSQIGATWHFYNGGDYLLGYYYSSGNTVQDPVTAKMFNVMKTGISSTNQCLSHYGGTAAVKVVMTLAEKQLCEQQYAYNLSNYLAVKTLYDNLKDGGSTEFTLLDIELSQPPDMWTLRSELLGSSPFLSDTVLRKVADKTVVFPNEVIFDIMAANPDELKKEAMLEYLESKEEPLPDYMIEILSQLAEGETYKTVLERQMTHYNQEKSRAAKDMIRSCLNDSILDMPTLRGWLNNLGGLEADKQIVASYIQEADYGNALSLAEMLPQLYRLTGNNLIEHDSYVQMLNLYKTLNDESRSIFELTESELDMISNLAQIRQSDAGSMAQGILTAVYNVYPNDCFELDDPLSLKRGNIDPTTLAKAQGMEIFPKPNPATDWIAFDYKLPKGETAAILRITDPAGKIIETISLEGNCGQVLLDTRSYKSGAYIYQMILGEMNLPGKFIIVK